MDRLDQQNTELKKHIADLGFPCTGAKTALAKGQITAITARDLRCPADDAKILSELYNFIKLYEADQELFRSCIVVFDGPVDLDEAAFEGALWGRLQALHDLDAKHHAWDPAVAADPADPNFSFSLGGKAFYLVTMHPQSSRKARRFAQPALIFNLHEQFERLRTDGSYATMRSVIRRRDRAFSGSVNPMLADFGDLSEARQYSGRQVGEDWRCPFSPRALH